MKIVYEVCYSQDWRSIGIAYFSTFEKAKTYKEANNYKYKGALYVYEIELDRED